MSTTIKDGGTAFPMQDPHAIHAYAQARVVNIPESEVAERDRVYLAARAQAVGGMSMRDYFAIHEPIDPNESIGKALAEKLVGRPLPEKSGFSDSGECFLACAIFWADAEAAYRYLRADAMLRAREGGAA